MPLVVRTHPPLAATQGLRFHSEGYARKSRSPLAPVYIFQAEILPARAPVIPDDLISLLAARYVKRLTFAILRLTNLPFARLMRKYERNMFRETRLELRRYSCDNRGREIKIQNIHGDLSSVVSKQFLLQNIEDGNIRWKAYIYL